MAVELAINVRDRDDHHESNRIRAQFFEDIDINLHFASVASTFRLDLLFDEKNKDHAELNCVSHIHECELDYIIEQGNRAGKKERMITGFMLSHGFVDDDKANLASVGGYSKCGMLQDCDIPTDCSLESNGLTFKEVVEKVVKAMNSKRKAGKFTFKIQSSRANERLVDIDKGEKKDTSGVMALIAEIEKGSAKVIEKTTAKESENALSYLKKIAIQKRLILSHDTLGNLVVGVPYTGDKYLFKLDTTNTDVKKLVGFKKITSNYDGQSCHSHITIIRQADKDGGNAAEFTILNPLVPVVYRPKVVILTSGDDITIEQAARNELGNNLKGIVVKIWLDRWEIDGKLVRPNNTVLIKAPRCYLYEPTKFFIESIQYQKNAKEEGAVLTCVLPYVYNNETPKNPFVEPGHNLPII